MAKINDLVLTELLGIPIRVAIAAIDNPNSKVEEKNLGHPINQEIPKEQYETDSENRVQKLGDGERDQHMTPTDLAANGSDANKRLVDAIKAHQSKIK